MQLNLRSLTDIHPDIRQRVVDIYKSDFSDDFRVRMDAHIININWEQPGINLAGVFSQKLRKAYYTNQVDDAAMLRRIGSSIQHYAQKFKVCITNEYEQCRSMKVRKRGRPSNTSIAATASNSGSAVATSPKQPHLQTTELQTSPISNVTTYKEAFQSNAQVNELDHRINQLLELFTTLASLQTLGEPNNQVFSYWCETAPKILDCAKQIHSSIADCLFAWDKRKRRLANQFEHNDERFDFRDDQFDQAAFDRVRSVYVEEVNTIENQAQKTVSCLYGVIDSAARWRSYYQNYQGLQVHLQIQEASNVEQKARQLIIELAKTTFIVWRQSEQVIKAGNKFKATVRLLVGPALRLDAMAPTVTVTMLTADILMLASASNSLAGRNAGVLVTSNPQHVPLRVVERPTTYDVTIMRTGPAGRKGKSTVPKPGNAQQQSMSAEFADITWKNEDKRSAKKDNELTVCELKYGAVFQTTFSLLGETVTLRCWSLPLILIVHASQECKAHGTIFWDNAFSEKRREPFAAPEEVSWYKFSRKFNRWFASQTRTPGNTLAPHNIHFVQSCLVERGTDKVTLFRFYRERLNWPIKFNFCEWIFEVQKLICEDAFLLYLWQRGAVYGFTTHETGIQLLRKNESDLGVKAMLLRFSTTPVYKKKGQGHVGLVIMTYISTTCDQLSIRSLMPATAEDLRGIADLRKRMLSAKVTREYLYPNCEWKDTLLRPYDTKNGLDQSESESVAKHYIKVDFDVVFPDEFSSNLVGELEASIDAVTQYPSAVSEPDLTRQLANDLGEHLAISNSSSSFAPFSNIQQFSGQNDLDNIDAFIPPDI